MDKEYALQQINNVIIEEIKSFYNEKTEKSPNQFIVTNTKMIDDIALQIFNDYNEDNEVELLIAKDNKKKNSWIREYMVDIFTLLKKNVETI